MRVLESERLTMVPWPEQHYDVIGALTADRRVTRYLGNGEPWDAAFVAVVAEKQRRWWDTVGYGWRIAVLKATGEPIAMAAHCPVGDGIPDLDPADHELGWWIAAEHWRQGYGAEMGHALRAAAHEDHGAETVIARLQPENLGSAGVATSIGLVYERNITGRFGEPNALYRGTAADWAAAAPR